MFSPNGQEIAYFTPVGGSNYSDERALRKVPVSGNALPTTLCKTVSPPHGASGSNGSNGTGASGGSGAIGGASAAGGNGGASDFSGSSVSSAAAAAIGASNAVVGARDEEASGTPSQHCSFTKKHVWRCKADY